MHRNGIGLNICILCIFETAKRFDRIFVAVSLCIVRPCCLAVDSGDTYKDAYVCVHVYWLCCVARSHNQPFQSMYGIPEEWNGMDTCLYFIVVVAACISHIASEQTESRNSIAISDPKVDEQLNE